MPNLFTHASCCALRWSPSTVPFYFMTNNESSSGKEKLEEGEAESGFSSDEESFFTKEFSPV